MRTNLLMFVALLLVGVSCKKDDLSDILLPEPHGKVKLT